MSNAVYWVCSRYTFSYFIPVYVECAHFLTHTRYLSCLPEMWYLPVLVCGFFLVLIPLWVVIARRSPPIREVLRSGWQPVIVAMSISR